MGQSPVAGSGEPCFWVTNLDESESTPQLVKAFKQRGIPSTEDSEST